MAKCVGVSHSEGCVWCVTKVCMWHKYAKSICMSPICVANGPIQNVIAQNSDLFASKGNTGFCDVMEFHIDTGSARPIVQKPYCAPLAKRQIIEQLIEEMLRNDIIQPSMSPWTSPVCLVPKRGGQDWRFCVDYRKRTQSRLKTSTHYLSFKTFLIRYKVLLYFRH